MNSNTGMLHITRTMMKQKNNKIKENEQIKITRKRYFPIPTAIDVDNVTIAAVGAIVSTS